MEIVKIDQKTLQYEGKTVSYLSGPISKKPNGNREAFFSAHNNLSLEGRKVLNPHCICSHLPDGSDWVEYMRVCVACLCEASEIVMLPGWFFSRGARWEWLIAKCLRLTVRYL